MFTDVKDISKRRELQHLMQDWKAIKGLIIITKYSIFRGMFFLLYPIYTRNTICIIMPQNQKEARG